jgi:hypothetical protein
MLGDVVDARCEAAGVGARRHRLGDHGLTSGKRKSPVRPIASGLVIYARIIMRV